MKSILTHLFTRYLKMTIDSPEFGEGDTSREYLISFMIHALNQINNLPEDKLNRWLGYIQGVLISYNVTTSEIERNYSRPLFHTVYKSRNIDIPETVNIGEINDYHNY